MVLLCDGRLTCGCADPYGRRVLGDTRTTSVSGVWTGEVASSLRSDIVAGGSKFCGDCPLKLPLKKDEAPPLRDLNVGTLPSRLYVECTAACNLSCYQACCAPETGITRTRQAGMLDVELFKRVIDEAGPSLGRIDFFNYGEAFLHKRAEEMCEYIKTQLPAHLSLHEHQRRGVHRGKRAMRLVHSGIDEVTFSIDGASQDTYVQYRQRGNFDKAIANLARWPKRRRGRAVTCRSSTGATSCSVERPRRGAGAGTADRARHRRRSARAGKSPITPRTLTPGGSCRATTTSSASSTRSGTTTTSATRFPARCRARNRRPDGGAGAADSGAARRAAAVRTRVRNLSTRRFAAQASYGRRLVRLGAQLCAADGSLINRDYARAWLPDHLEGGQSADVAIEVPAPDRAGPVPAEVRSRQRGHRLVRGLRLSYDIKTLLVV